MQALPSPELTMHFKKLPALARVCPLTARRRLLDSIRVEVVADGGYILWQHHRGARLKAGVQAGR